MKKMRIKYQSGKQPDFINELRKKVKDYFATNNISKYGNSSLIIKTIFMLFLYLVPYGLMMAGLVNSLSGTMTCWLIMGFGIAGVGMGFMHDANHGTYSGNRKINRIMGYSLYLLGGFPPNWQYQHNVLHHGFTNIEGHDEDIDPGIFLRLSPHKPLYKFHRAQHWYAWFFYSLMTLSWATVKDFKQLIRYKKSNVVLNNNETYPGLLLKLIVTKTAYYFFFLIMPILILPISWYWVLLSFFVMHFTSGLILATVFQTAHVVTTSEFPLPDKSGNIENDWAIHQLLTTSDFAPKSKLLTWFTGGLNYQIEHHLFPNISHVHYKKLSSVVKETAKKHGLPYHVQSTFFSAVLNHTKMLRSLGRKSGKDLSGNLLVSGSVRQTG